MDCINLIHEKGIENLVCEERLVKPAFILYYYIIMLRRSKEIGDLSYIDQYNLETYEELLKGMIKE